MNFKNTKKIQDLEKLQKIMNLQDDKDSKQEFFTHHTLLNHNIADSMKHNSKKPQNAFKDSMIRVVEKRDIYVSCGDINGVSLELILKNHNHIAKWCNPIYCVSYDILSQAASLLNIKIPNMQLYEVDSKNITINPSKASKDSGAYSFKSFEIATNLALEHNAALVTLPINKYAWNLAGIKYAGHTEYLRQRFKKNAIMMLGNEDMFVALFSDHVPLESVSKLVTKNNLDKFLNDFYECYLKRFYKKANNITESKNESDFTQNIDSIKHHLESKEKSDNTLKNAAINSKMVSRLLDDDIIESKNDIQTIYKKDTAKQVAVLGLNPHAGDNGVLGKEDFIIKDCINDMNKKLGFDLFVGPISPDCAFIPANREAYRIFIAMYHDSGLAPLKALYFDNSINISLNIPILRVSPDHGTCYDIAYKKDSRLNSQSYIECFKFIVLN